MKHSLIFTLIITTLILTGCIKINTSLKINADGSSDVTLVYGVDKQLAAMDKDFSLEEFTTEAEANGYKVKKFEDDRFVGYKLTSHYETLAELSKKLDYNGLSIKVEEDKGFFKTKYIVTGNINLSDMTENNNNGFEQQFAESFMRQMDLKFSLTLPQKAGKNNASEVKDDGKTLIWELKVNSENKLEVQYEKMNILNISFIIGVIIGIFAIVGVARRKMLKA
ncbi:LppM family (lipo)protein [Bacillus marasmi]|uniref:LppM family (lipo)protein n=1 Tax=Bacillus marasmi TaxID=1926279 RepID=UPI0011C9D8A4|nr:DUF3153 domain-containing protein [Bacillus marasmi]